jgi:hypothetical protein
VPITFNDVCVALARRKEVAAVFATEQWQSTRARGFAALDASRRGGVQGLFGGSSLSSLPVGFGRPEAATDEPVAAAAAALATPGEGPSDAPRRIKKKKKKKSSKSNSKLV